MKRKVCTICGKKKPLTEYYTSGKLPSGKIKIKSRCKTCANEASKKYGEGYYKEHQEQQLATSKKWQREHPEQFAIKNREWKDNNKEHCTKKSREWQRAHPECSRAWHNRALKENIDYRIAKNLRERVRKVLKGAVKSDKTLELLGCTIKKLKAHLKKRFKKGMSFRNYGKWHLDHETPCASFDLTDPEQQKKCFHYTNLQPLWADENRKKGAKIA